MRKRIMPYALVAILAAAHGTPLYCAPLVIHLAVSEFGWSRLAGSLAISVMWIMTAIMAPVVGLMIRRVGPRTLVLVGAALASLGFGSIALAAAPAHAVMSQVVVGIGTACAGMVTLTSVLTAAAPRSMRGRYTGLLTVGISLPGVTLLPVVERICSVFGWRTGALAVGATIAITIIPIALTLVPRRLEVGAGELREAPQVMDLPGSVPAQRRDLVLRWLMLVGFCLIMCGSNSVLVHLIPNLTELGFSVKEAALGLSILALLVAIGKISMGWAVDRFPVMPVLLICYVAQVISIVMLFFVKSFASLIAFLLVYAGSVGGIVPLHPLAVLDIFGQDRFPREYGLIAFGPTLGNALGAIVVGYLHDTSGSYTIPNIARASMCLAAVGLLLVIMFVRRTSPVYMQQGWRPSTDTAEGGY